MSGWSLVFDGLDPAAEGHRETLCTLGNGVFATRGAVPEAPADGTHYPGTYIAGVYDTLTTVVSGREVTHEDLVNAPNWLSVTFRRTGGRWLDLADVQVLEHRQELDLKRGILIRRFRIRDADGRRTAVTQRRLVSMADPRLAALETTILPEDWSGTLEVRTVIDGGVVNGGVARYRELEGRHLRVATAEADGSRALLVANTVASDVTIAMASRIHVHAGGSAMEVGARAVTSGDRAGQILRFEARVGEAVTVEKVVGVATSRDRGSGDPADEARVAVDEAPDCEAIMERHVLAWDHLWSRCDLEVAGHERTAMILRLHIFHLLQTVSEHTIDRDVGVPARGLHGEAYRGHIFWDELFIFPFLDLRFPELTRALLRYRARRLPAARRAARAAGLAGAAFPWQSASDGSEVSQTWHLNPRSGRWLPDHSHLQRHINAAIAYNVWRHHQVTGDVTFLSFSGAELFAEIARMFASLAEYDRARDRYVIRGVVGPDEYHDAYPDREEPGLDNNAYTNVMAAWVLWRAGDVLDRVPRARRDELLERLSVRREERERWEDISRRLFVPFHDDRIISQFEGYEHLDELDWEKYRERYGSIRRLDRILEAEGDTVNRYKASKQADALMLFYLFPESSLAELFHRLGYDLDDEMVARTVEHYLARTAHGSTLSSVTHAWVLARSDPDRAWALFTEALESDIADVQGGTTAEGIHLGAMAGTVDLVQRCFAGIDARDDALCVTPCLPAELGSLRFRIRYRQHWGVEVEIRDGEVRVALPAGRDGPIRVVVDGVDEVLEPGTVRTFATRTR